MKSISTALTAGALAAAGVLSVSLSLPTAAADPDPSASTHPLGSQGTLAEGPGVQGWTISDLRPSSDSIPYQPRGTLWEATATDEALQGSAIPIIANLNAQSSSGQNYQSLFNVPTAQGIVPRALTEGQKTSGKVYFDVTGDAPDSLVYQSGGNDLIRWVAPAPQPKAPAATPPAPQAPAAHPQPPAAAPQPQTPHGGAQSPANSHPNPAPKAPARPAQPRPATPPPSGSAGTPLPGGSAGTPLPAGSP